METYVCVFICICESVYGIRLCTCAHGFDARALYICLLLLSLLYAHVTVTKTATAQCTWIYLVHDNTTPPHDSLAAADQLVQCRRQDGGQLDII